MCEVLGKNSLWDQSPSFRIVHQYPGLGTIFYLEAMCKVLLGLIFFFFIRRNFSLFWVCYELPCTVKACASHSIFPFPPEYLSPGGGNQTFACISYGKELAGHRSQVHPTEDLTVSFLSANTSCYNQCLVCECSLVTPNP